MALLADALRNGASQSPTKPALIAGERSTSYQELDDLSSAAAARLTADGVRPGDRIALHLTNGLEIVVAYFACFKSGAIALPINTRFKTAEIEYVLGHAEAAAYVGQPDLAREVREWPAHVRVKYLKGELIDESTLRSKPDTASLLHAADDDAPAAVLYTSGTTARPKGVTHTQRTFTAMADCGSDILGDLTGSVYVPLPMVHISALLGLIASVNAGLTIVTSSQFEPNAFLDAFQKHRVRAATGMPVMYRALVEAQRQQSRDVSSGLMYAVGGDSVPTALQQQFTELFGRPLIEVYGLSEIVPVSMNSHEAMRVGSLGRPSRGIAVRVVDADGRDVPRGETGEICVKAPGVFVGYWNNPEATAQAFRDGWFLTGDLGYEDADGFYWFAGRKKEIIVRGGSNVSPQEVEEAVYQHPAVAEAAVVGVPDDRWGEIVVSAVVLRHGETVAASDLIAFVRERLSLYKCPERVLFLPALPKGPTGKVLRRAVKDSFCQHLTLY